MNDPNDIRKAWSYIEAFRVSGQLTPAERTEWQVVVEMMSKDDFDRARAGARSRPMDRARFRPTPDEFWGFLEAQAPAPKPQAEHGPHSEWTGHDYGETTPGAAAAAERVFSQFAALMPSRRNQVQR